MRLVWYGDREWIKNYQMSLHALKMLPYTSPPYGQSNTFTLIPIHLKSVRESIVSMSITQLPGHLKHPAFEWPASHVWIEVCPPALPVGSFGQLPLAQNFPRAKSTTLQHSETIQPNMAKTKTKSVMYRDMCVPYRIARPPPTPAKALIRSTILPANPAWPAICTLITTQTCWPPWIVDSKMLQLQGANACNFLFSTPVFEWNLFIANRSRLQQRTTDYRPSCGSFPW